MLFSEQRSAAKLQRDSSGQRRSLLSDLVASFNSAFPAIQYQVFTELDLLNGQALVLGLDRIVRLYGGLALHPSVSRDGLAFALLHETGHHLAAGARLPWNPLMACECAADAWAYSVGREALGRSSGWFVNMAKAVGEVSALIATEENGPSIFPKTNATDCGTC